MIVYIKDNDNRCKVLADLMKQDGHQIETDVKMLTSCQLVYLGKDGSGFEQVDFQNQAIVLTLLKNQRLTYLSKLKGFIYQYLYSDEKFILENTYISDEALIAYMIIDNQISIANSKILILGYGHCGQDLASKLSRFNAKISVANRDNHHFDEVVKEGYSYHSLKHLNLNEYDFIINTIPKPVITKKILKTKKPIAKIYDLSSKPYGVHLSDRDDQYHLLKQLPTKYAYQSSGLVLYQAIKRVVEKHAGK